MATKVTKYQSPRTGETRIEVSLGEQKHSLGMAEALLLAKSILQAAGGDGAKRLVIEPNGWPCRLADCPPGLLVYGEAVCIKTEYGGEAYLADSGEVLSAGAKGEMMVWPCEARWQDGI